jgi:hypothetical protein
MLTGTPNGEYNFGPKEIWFFKKMIGFGLQQTFFLGEDSEVLFK